MIPNSSAVHSCGHVHGPASGEQENADAVAARAFQHNLQAQQTQHTPPAEQDLSTAPGGDAAVRARIVQHPNAADGAEHVEHGRHGAPAKPVENAGKAGQDALRAGDSSVVRRDATPAAAATMLAQEAHSSPESRNDQL